MGVAQVEKGCQKIKGMMTPVFSVRRETGPSGQKGDTELTANSS